jgi:gamma-glutamylaminecyclotransferase
MKHTVFAFGSNLDPTQMASRCPTATGVTAAVLPNYRLAFGGWSNARRGPVATVKRCDGRLVWGALYRINDRCLRRLDGYEGCPHQYARVQMRVHDVYGLPVWAWVYVLQNPGADSTPSANYAQAIYKGHEFWGLPTEAITRALKAGLSRKEDDVDTPPKTKVFVYGSLRRGFGNSRLLKNADYLGVGQTEPEFTMLNLGAFPGVIDGGDTSITGEIYDVTPTELRRLDQLEGHPDFYRRTPIELVDGTEVEVYLLPDSYLHHYDPTMIPSGDWTDVPDRRRVW